MNESEEEAHIYATKLETENEELREGIEEALRCLTLIGHVKRIPGRNTWARRCEAATKVLSEVRGNPTYTVPFPDVAR